jgi:L-rhamnose-H+ transport protein
MNVFILYGILSIALGALMSGSFAIPFDKVKEWKWENYWLVFCFFGYLVMPLGICLLFAPAFLTALGEVPLQTVLWVFLLGAIYGAANMTFGLSLRYLGIALGYALSLGLMMAIGTLVPPIIDGRLAMMFDGEGGMLLIAGIVISLAGIALSGYAGYMKSKETTTKEGVNSEFDLRKGLAAALFVGITGSAAALGIEQGAPIATACTANGTNPLFSDSAVFLVLYGGAFFTTLLGCLYLAARSKSIKCFVKVGSRSLWKNYLFCALAGFLWYINYVFFGMGKAQMGAYSFVAWGILMTLTIVFATLWGLYRKEWKNVSRKCYALMWTGLFILLAASFLIGISSNY